MSLKSLVPILISIVMLISTASANQPGHPSCSPVNHLDVEFVGFDVAGGSTYRVEIDVDPFVFFGATGGGVSAPALRVVGRYHPVPAFPLQTFTLIELAASPGGVHSGQGTAYHIPPVGAAEFFIEVEGFNLVPFVCPEFRAGPFPVFASEDGVTSYGRVRVGDESAPNVMILDATRGAGGQIDVRTVAGPPGRRGWLFLAMAPAMTPSIAGPILVDITGGVLLFRGVTDSAGVMLHEFVVPPEAAGEIWYAQVIVYDGGSPVYRSSQGLRVVL